VVDRSSLSSVGSLFYARGAATEKLSTRYVLKLVCRTILVLMNGRIINLVKVGNSRSHFLGHKAGVFKLKLSQNHPTYTSTYQASRRSVSAFLSYYVAAKLKDKQATTQDRLQ